MPIFLNSASTGFSSFVQDMYGHHNNAEVPCIIGRFLWFLLSFREGKFRCLVATDVAARGLGIPQVDPVMQCMFEVITRN